MCKHDILYRALEHPWTSVFTWGPRTNPPWILKDNSSFLGVKSYMQIWGYTGVSMPNSCIVQVSTVILDGSFC